MYTVEQIRQNITTRHDWAERAIVRLYQEQTAAEQSALQTTDKNGVGFNALDAEILSSFAQQVMSGRVRRDNNCRLSEKQFALAFKKLGKYAGQLYRLSSQTTSSVVEVSPTVCAVEASSLGIRPGEVRLAIVHNSRSYEFKKTHTDSEGDVTAWTYQAVTGEILNVFND